MTEKYDVSDAIKPKSDQLNAEDLLGTTITAEVERVKITDTEQPLTVWLKGHVRPWKPCKSMGKVLAFAWSRDSRNWIGKSVTLYCDPDVTWAGVKVGGIRVSHLSHIQSSMDMSLAVTKGKRKPYRVDPLKVEAPKPPPAYPADQFAEKLPAMRDAIEAGKMTPEQVIQRCEKTGTLTDEQKAAITAPIENQDADNDTDEEEF